MTMADIHEALSTVRAVSEVVPISEETHDLGFQIAERYGLSFYDAMIVASALLAGCGTLISEDMQDGQAFDSRLKVRNPFR